MFALIILFTIYLLPPAAAAPSAIIQNDSSYVDSAGYYHVVGEVLNTGDASLSFIKISGVFKDSGGQVVDTDFTYAYADYLPAGQKAPFEMFMFDKQKSALIVSYALVLEYRATTEIFQTQLAIQGAASSKNSLGWLEVVGEVKNSGAETATFTKVIGTFYDQAGKVIYVDSTYTSPTDIPSGQAYGFKITVISDIVSSRIANYALFAESHQYTSIPEWPWPALILGIGLSLGVVAVRRKSLGG